MKEKTSDELIDEQIAFIEKNGANMEEGRFSMPYSRKEEILLDAILEQALEQASKEKEKENEKKLIDKSYKPKVGQLLYRGCACDEYGEILKVGIENDMDVIDVLLIDATINDLYYPCSQYDDPEEEYYRNTRIELPPNIPVIVRDLEYTVVGNGHIVCATTAGRCFRCSQSFYPHDKGKAVDFDAVTNYDDDLRASKETK